MYTEDDISDAEDLYGRTKFLGEVGGSGCLTLRTSIIGRELRTTSGLVEWFLSNRGSKVRGYTRAIYSGFTTLALAQIIADVLERHPGLSGVYHVSSEPINKYDLLCLLRDAFGLHIEIEPYPDVQIDRSLDSRRFRAATGFVSPAWPEMIHAMAADPTPYERWRNIYNGA
jgi:dTDP-4-dehydrorhamnose reductase